MPKVTLLKTVRDSNSPGLTFPTLPGIKHQTKKAKHATFFVSSLNISDHLVCAESVLYARGIEIKANKCPYDVYIPVQRAGREFLTEEEAHAKLVKRSFLTRVKGTPRMRSGYKR